MRVVHYLNQFFGGIGGEEVAGTPPDVREGAVGPGRLLAQLLGPDAEVVKTIVCGDNWAAENLPALTQRVVNDVREAKADLFVAGPCYEAGRYGLAAGALCVAVQTELGITAVTGMAEENPGTDIYRRELYIIDSGQNVASMRDVLTKMAAIAGKLMRKETIGSPAQEGYLARGLLHDDFVEETAAERLVSMLYAKTTGLPYESELRMAIFPKVQAPAPIINLAGARVAIVTDGGVVPKGNPDRISASAATNWGAYNISGLTGLEAADYEVSHGGFDRRYVELDPDRMVPVDALRDLEAQGVIGSLHNQFISTSGLSNPIVNSRRLGREIAAKLKEDEVDAVILVSAWGTSTRCGAAISTELERAGIPVAQITSVVPVAKMVGTNRIIRGNGIVHPLGNPDLPPEEEKKLRERILRQALEALQQEAVDDVPAGSS